MFQHRALKLHALSSYGLDMPLFLPDKNPSYTAVARAFLWADRKLEITIDDPPTRKLLQWLYTMNFLALMDLVNCSSVLRVRI